MKSNILSILTLSAALLGIGTAQAAYDKEYNIATDSVINITAAGKYLIFDNDYSVFEHSITIASDITDTVFITMRNINVKPTTEGSALKIGANTTVNLYVEGEETTLTGKNTGCGIEAVGNVVIDADSATIISIKAGSGRAAGLGTVGSSEAAGNITINGGMINVSSGIESAGIGASNAGRLGNITINGGQIHATGGAYSSAIGASYVSKGSAIITINGGTIYAQSGYYCNGRSIGRGNKTHSGTITAVINGGNIIAKGEKGETNGTIDPAPTDASDNALSLVTCQLAGEIYEPTAITSGQIGNIILGTGYGLNDVYSTEDGLLYFYLPEQSGSISVTLNGTAGTLVNDNTGIAENRLTAINITTLGQDINIREAAGLIISVNDLTGKCILSRTLDSNNETISMPVKGMYIVSIAQKTTKIILK